VTSVISVFPPQEFKRGVTCVLQEGSIRRTLRNYLSSISVACVTLTSNACLNLNPWISMYDRVSTEVYSHVCILD